MQQFEASVNQFVSQIESVEYLNLFVTCLLDEDVTIDMYPTVPRQQKEQQPGKINRVCTLLRSALEGRNEYMQTILTTEAKQTPSALDSAMRRIYELKSHNVQEAESALKYLIFLADVEVLYNVALGMYDFQLVLMVAQHSQKDPKEYLAFLSDLSQHEKYYQRFLIDDHLKKHESALKNLSLAQGKFDETLKYMENHKLYTFALTLYEKTSTEFKAVCTKFAEYNLLKLEHFQAAMCTFD
jgi:elongator complex protein 1